MKRTYSKYISEVYWQNIYKFKGVHGYWVKYCDLFYSSYRNILFKKLQRLLVHINTIFPVINVPSAYLTAKLCTVFIERQRCKDRWHLFQRTNSYPWKFWTFILVSFQTTINNTTIIYSLIISELVIISIAFMFVQLLYVYFNLVEVKSEPYCYIRQFLAERARAFCSHTWCIK